MNALLFASLAANLVALIALMVLIVGREDARRLASHRLKSLVETEAALTTAEEARDDLHLDLALTREMNGSLLAEVTELRAERARRMAPLIAANAKRKADAAKAH
jgi:hypothetical protein